MPIKIQKDLPAKAILESENIFVMDEDRAMSQDIRPLEILILNLMPIKEDTETQLLRALSNTPLQVDCSFLMLETHVSKNTSQTHLNKFYVTFDEIRRKRFDGMIITGAPVENMEFEEINYWDELTKIMEWSKTHVTSTLHICWGMQAGLYYHYGIQKHQRKTKLSGIYRHRLLNRKIPLVRSLDDYFYCPHSRYTEDREEDILKHPELQILAKSDEAGVFLVMNQYHLFSHEDKLKALNEAKRVVRPGGIILVAYLMNEYSVITYAFKEQHIMECLREGRLTADYHTVSSEKDLYDYMRTEDIARLNEEAGLTRVQIISPDGAANYIRPYLNKLTDEEFNEFIKYHLSTCERADMLGAAAHTLDILRK